MNIAIVCSSREHPVFPWLEHWSERQREQGHQVSLVQKTRELPEAGDLLFLVSCGEIVREDVRSRFTRTLLLHASDLPEGRGWSPHIWEILDGADELTVTLLEAAEPVDTGDIWAKRRISLNGTELYDEINEKLFAGELELLDVAVQQFHEMEPQPQPLSGYGRQYRLRNPADSELDPERSIAEQFDLLRVCDPDRFPAYFRYRGQMYRVQIEKVRDDEQAD